MPYTHAVSPLRRPQTPCTVQIYPHGAITDRGRLEGHSASIGKHPRTRRSEITTLSRASAARLRKLLAQIKGPDGWVCFGATLTVPGPPITADEWRRLWDAYRHRLLRLGNICLIWRIELQERGQPHIHCICWAKKGSWVMRNHWLENLGILGPYEGEWDVRDTDGKWTIANIKVSHRGLWRGASEHAVKINVVGNWDNVGWWRYLAAHASKSKQAQLGWKGRQWGILNGKLLDRETPCTVTLSQRGMNKAARCLRRLTGCRYASSHGTQTWFIRPSTIQRVFEWAKAATE